MVSRDVHDGSVIKTLWQLPVPSLQNSFPTKFWIGGDTQLIGAGVLMSLLFLTAMRSRMLTIRKSTSKSKRSDPTADPRPKSAQEVSGSHHLDQPRDRIVRYLERHNGRAMQAEIVADSEKSAATISRYLSELEAENVVQRTRVRRSKLVIFTESSEVRHELSKPELILEESNGPDPEKVESETLAKHP